MTRKTDISVFVPSLEVGGAELAMLQIANGFAERGLQVDLVLIEAKGVFMNQVSEKVRIVNLDSHRTRYSIWKLYQYLQKEKPKGLISALDGANVIAILAKFLSSVPTRIIITINSYLSLNYNPKNDKNLAQFNSRALFQILKFVYRYADEIVAISTGVADDVSRITKIKRHKVHVFYLPVLTDRFYRLKTQTVENQSLLAKDALNIVSVGRLTPAKDFVTLIRAFSIVSKEIPSKLLILGEGESRQELERLISEYRLTEKVLLPGFLKNCYPYMEKCDLFVVSSAWEGLSTVLIEALACGATVVSTDCKSGPREILQNGSWGHLVPVGDYKAMASAMKKSLEGRLGKKLTPEHVFDPFRLEVVIDKYQNLIMP